jgi:DNA-binding IclR family transcriptional regulator
VREKAVESIWEQLLPGMAQRSQITLKELYMGKVSVDRSSSNSLPLLSEKGAQIQSRFKSARRIFRIIDLIASEQGKGLAAKQIAREIGVNLSSCYCLINILIDEGYVEKMPHGGGYKLGPAVCLLYERYSENDLDSRVEPVIDELAQRAETHAYFGLLSDGLVTVTKVKSPPKSPPVGIVKGFQGASHALALGKVLLASSGAEGIREYIDTYGLGTFTSRTIIHPGILETHLSKIRTLGVATDMEEFAENLCCVSAQVKGEGGKVEGAIGLSTTAQRAQSELPMLVELAQWAAEEASALLSKDQNAGAKL